MVCIKNTYYFSANSLIKSYEKPRFLCSPNGLGFWGVFVWIFRSMRLLTRRLDVLLKHFNQTKFGRFNRCLAAVLHI